MSLFNIGILVTDITPPVGVRRWGTLRAGELILLGLPGETVSEYRKILRSRSPLFQPLILSMANDFIGYLPSDEILKEGANEAWLSPPHPADPRKQDRYADEEIVI